MSKPASKTASPTLSQRVVGSNQHVLVRFKRAKVGLNSDQGQMEHKFDYRKYTDRCINIEFTEYTTQARNLLQFDH